MKILNGTKKMNAPVPPTGKRPVLCQICTHCIIFANNDNDFTSDLAAAKYYDDR